MDIKRSEDQDRGSRKPADDQNEKRDSLPDRLLAVVVLVAIFGGAASIAIGLPHALAIATSHANGSPAIVKEGPTLQQHYPLDTIEEERDPLIVDDIRIEGVLHATEDVSRTIEPFSG